jgi:hypothetical protein
MWTALWQRQTLLAILATLSQVHLKQGCQNGWQGLPLTQGRPHAHSEQPSVAA